MNTKITRQAAVNDWIERSEELGRRLMEALAESTDNEVRHKRVTAAFTYVYATTALLSAVDNVDDDIIRDLFWDTSDIAFAFDAHMRTSIHNRLFKGNYDKLVDDIIEYIS